MDRVAESLKLAEQIVMKKQARARLDAEIHDLEEQHAGLFKTNGANSAGLPAPREHGSNSLTRSPKRSQIIRYLYEQGGTLPTRSLIEQMSDTDPTKAFWILLGMKKSGLLEQPKRGLWRLAADAKRTLDEEEEQREPDDHDIKF